MGIFTNKARVSDSFKEKLAKVINGETVEEEKKVKEAKVEEVKQLDESSEAVEVTEDLENLDEAQLVEILEAELTGYISYLLDEGFSDDEVEALILAALEDDEPETLEEQPE